MFMLGNFINALAQILNFLITVLYWLILIRVLISWVNPDPSNTLVQFLYKATEPILYPIRKMLPVNFRFGLDVSPLVAFLILLFLRLFLIRTLLDLATRLRA